MYPVVLLCGKAGSGKDTVANFMAQDHGAVCIAQADPLKRFASRVFAFTEEQLWGPSECRNAVDARGKIPEYWGVTNKFFDCEGAFESQFVADWMNCYLNSHPRSSAAWNIMAKWYLGLKDKPLTPRNVLQTLGTEVGRKIHPQAWVMAAQNTAMSLLEEGGTYDRTRGHSPGPNTPPFVVVTDGRFKNEILSTKKNGGLVINVINPADEQLTGDAGKHSSETSLDSIPGAWYDIQFLNDKKLGLEECRYQVAAMVKNSVLRRSSYYLSGYKY
jgi:hypothetical protein